MNARLAELQAWYEGREPREQRLLLGGGVLALALVLLVAVLALHGMLDRAEQRVAAKRADAAYIRSVLPELRAAPVPQVGGQSLVVIVDRSTRDAGLAMHLRGTEPAGQNAVRVRFDAAPFDSVVTWLLRLQREHGLAVQAAAIDRGGAPGLVNASLTLARP